MIGRSKVDVVKEFGVRTYEMKKSATLGKRGIRHYMELIDAKSENNLVVSRLKGFTPL